MLHGSQVFILCSPVHKFQHVAYTAFLPIGNVVDKHLIVPISQADGFLFVLFPVIHPLNDFLIEKTVVDSRG